MRTSSSAKRNTLFIVIALLVLALIWFAVVRWGADKAAKPPAPPVAVSVVQALEKDVPIYLTGVGTVTPNATVTVKARVDGALEKVGFVEGQEVKAGQLLAQLDPRTLQAQLEQVQAQRAKDQALLNNAMIDLQRYTTLRSEDAATQQTLDTQRALTQQLAAAIKTDDAQIAYAKVQLGFTTINAPISGRVGARLVDPGNIVHATDAVGLVVINQIDPITVLFTLPEDAVPAIIAAQNAGKAALKVLALPRSGGPAISSGSLILLNNQIDTTSGTVQLKARFANANHALWPGQYLNARLMLGDHQKVVTVPAAAIQRNQEGTYVYLAGADNTVQIQPVKVTQIQDGVAVVGEGVQVGQNVVLDGQYKLRPGARIVVSKPAAAVKGPAK
ncbi:efflux RND transporter periplasmic adaptor subunit [Herbaspirillum sp. RTI4]|uniref:efflux RND transporter periplasmic adaptor subunit n=1 Tax=Herbaspirillum sp. RTI4 TaxID=3048640 RepID=UPI002AB4377B|nr:efflux RND transporter periplasmic adaptor subunit [Herbaspirillum sp. RTI4]MDY7578479.1 efflux RND transporter periplasmic adaptor subunit [Herbaspirillum sp. RTI4]MEA9981492.1 efflux RND transporter periplasmic adaptor subunit [Herbaspirillum sp. RTI4]